MKEIIVFDTTLRDGEQTPGANINIKEKIQIASQLENLGVDIIEAGFAAASNSDFQAIELISENVINSTICSLARAKEYDIKKAGEAIKKAKNKRLHTFIATSKIHMENKLNMSEEEVIKRAVDSVIQAKEYTDDVQFSFEDATRSDLGFLCEISSAIIEAGVKTINIPDTVGFSTPKEIENLIKNMYEWIGDKAIISVHNHNDLGLAVINTLVGIENGARQIECTINGLGERAGNASLEELTMILKMKSDIYPFKTNINTKEIYTTSKMVSEMSGITPQKNKAIIGENAFSHESGIHQDGMIKNKETYQYINPDDIGYKNNKEITLGKLSGRNALNKKIKELGYSVNEKQLNIIFSSFKHISENKKEIFDNDIISIIKLELEREEYKLLHFRDYKIIENNLVEVFVMNTSKLYTPILTNKRVEGNGIIDSLFKSIDKTINQNNKLLTYEVKAKTKYKESLAEVNLSVKINDKIYNGYGLDLDTVRASGLAYVDAIDKSIKENG